MKKAVLAMAVAASFSASTFATGEHQIYGKAHVSVDNVDQGDGTELKISSNASRVGIKGSESLGDSVLTAVYRLEWEVDITDESGVSTTTTTDQNGEVSAKSKSNFTARNQYGGLKGGFGTVLFGRHDTPLKMSQGKFDLFNDQFGDIKKTLAGELRASNIFAYVTPEAGRFTGVLALVPTEDEENDLTASVAALIEMDKIYLGLAYDDYAGGGNLARVTTTFDLGPVRLGAMYNQAGPEEGDSADGWAANVALETGAKGRIKLQYQDGEGQTVGKVAKIRQGGTVTSVGYEYKLAKSTSIYAAYHLASFDETDADEETVASLGLIHKFGIQLK